MRVILQGSLRHFAASELLSLLGSRAHTGTLDVESTEGRARLSFRDGRLEWTEATGAADAREIVAKLVSWGDGAFTFLDDIALPEGVTPLGLDVAPLIAEAEARAAEARRMALLYPDEQIAFRVINRPKVEGEISLSPEEFQVLFQISGGRSLAQLRMESNRPPGELYPIVHKLQTIGLIQVVADPDQTAKLEPAEEPPPSAPPPKPQLKTTVSQKRPKTIEQKHAPIGTLTADDGTMHPLLEEVSTIGRTAKNDIALGDGSVSSNHARILRTDDGFLIEDLHSRNGTFVNSEKVTEKRVLADGDLVRMGKVILTFNLAVETRMKDTTQPELKK